MDTSSYSEKLEAEKARLETQLAKIGRRNVVVPNDWEASNEPAENEADPLDQAEVIASQENSAAILTTLEEQYDRVIGALDRIAKGTYGICAVCGKPIEAERLDADPTATTCIAHR